MSELEAAPIALPRLHLLGNETPFEIDCERAGHRLALAPFGRCARRGGAIAPPCLRLWLRKGLCVRTTLELDKKVVRALWARSGILLETREHDFLEVGGDG